VNEQNPPAKAAYDTYVACFTSPTAALLDLAARAGIAVAYLDRDTIEVDRALTDDEWRKITDELDWYDEHVSTSGEVNAFFLDQVFASAGVARWIDDTTGHDVNADDSAAA
jgi:hypothetical protein